MFFYQLQLLPHFLDCDAVKKLSSGSMIILIITWVFRIILQNIWRRVVGSSRSNISLSNIFATLLLTWRFHQNCQTAFGIVCINGLNDHCLRSQNSCIWRVHLTIPRDRNWRRYSIQYQKIILHGKKICIEKVKYRIVFLKIWNSYIIDFIAYCMSLYEGCSLFIDKLSEAESANFNKIKSLGGGQYR